MNFCFSFDVCALGTWIVVVDLQCMKILFLNVNTTCCKVLCRGLIAELMIVRGQLPYLTKKEEVGGKLEIEGGRFEEN